MLNFFLHSAARQVSAIAGTGPGLQAHLRKRNCGVGGLFGTRLSGWLSSGTGAARGHLLCAGKRRPWIV